MTKGSVKYEYHKNAKDYFEKMCLRETSNLMQTDPEFAERLYNFAFDEVVNEPGMGLDDKTRFMAILSTLLGCQGLDAYKQQAEAALNFGLTPVELKEIVYQAVDYLGIGRVYPFLIVTNEILTQKGVALPLENQATITMENRLGKGVQAQVDIFGDDMKGFYKKSHINRWLAANCFGDYYTRTGLNYKQREMITFCFLAAQGGCEVQLTSHAAGNMRIGNDKDFLMRVVSQCVPYIGYPRSLNAITCINNAAKSMEEN